MNPTCMDLAGRWRFKEDPDDRGVEEAWFTTCLDGEVMLPGTMDENGKGPENTDRDCTIQLSRERVFVGKAWYQKEIDLPEEWHGCSVTLTFERSRFVTLWMDGRRVGEIDSLGCPQVFELGSSLEPGPHTLTVCVDNAPKPYVHGGHQMTESTQVNWNGILGKMMLQAHDPVHLKQVRVTPMLSQGQVQVRCRVSNQSGSRRSAEIHLSVRGVGFDHVLPDTVLSEEIDAGDSLIDVSIAVPDDVRLWDEFEPNLYEITVSLVSGSETDRICETFGMRDFTTGTNGFSINGKGTFLRGKHEALVFPLTGYAPMDVASWERVFRVAKSYGVNFYRFHSCTPPKAAFVAADRVGMYLQPELYQFGGQLGRHPGSLEYMKREGKRILETYGNHPSFVMFALGNEIKRSQAVGKEIITFFREVDATRLYAQGSNNDFGNPTLAQGDDYWTTARTKKKYAEASVRGSFGCVDLPYGHVQAGPPSTRREYTPALTEVPIPVLAHETGQYQSFPNFDEIDKYTGVQKPWNLERFKARLEQAGLLDQWRDFFSASGQLAVICYREEIEAALRTSGLAGFQLLDLQDYPGQGTALVGMLDAFMDSKGFITPEKWREFCSPVVPLVLMDRYTWSSGETFSFDVEIANYGSENFVDQPVRVTLSHLSGEPVIEHVLTATAPQGQLTNLGELQLQLPHTELAQKMQLGIELVGHPVRNSYPIWLYPPASSVAPVHTLKISRCFNEVMQRMERGEDVLFFPEIDSLNQAVEGTFASDFWCFPMFNSFAVKQGLEPAPGTLGILCDPEHPAFSNFPTEFHTNWQWWHLIMNSRAMILDDFPPELRPIVQVIDNIDRNHRLGLMIECRVGEGRLLLCSIDLPGLQAFPEARQLMYSLECYMASAAFRPSLQVHPKHIEALLLGKDTTTNHGATEGFDAFFNPDA